MDITGKLVLQLEEQGGEGKNGPWKKRNFVLETSADKYPKKVCITAWSDQADQIMKIGIGSTVKVSFDLESREYNGKWYTDAKAWKIESQGGGSSESIPSSNEYASADISGAPMGADDLPF